MSRPEVTVTREEAERLAGEFATDAERYRAIAARPGIDRARYNDELANDCAKLAALLRSYLELHEAGAVLMKKLPPSQPFQFGAEEVEGFRAALASSPLKEE